MNSDSRWLSDSWELFTDPAKNNEYHTSLYSVTICPVRIQMCSARHAVDKNGSDKLSWEQTLIWVWALIQQIRVLCTSRQTGIARPKLTSRKGEKQQRRRDASTSGKEQPRQRGSTDKLDYTFRCNERQQQTFFNMENVYVFDSGSICVHGKELLRNFTFHQKYR